jgi:hypothetical protein
MHPACCHPAGSDQCPKCQHHPELSGVLVEPKVGKAVSCDLALSPLMEGHQPLPDSGHHFVFLVTQKHLSVSLKLSFPHWKVTQAR